MSTLYEQARALAMAGIKVFPCLENSKFPATAHGFKDASSDPAQWAKWRAEFPNCNWGVPTGARNGFDVFDGDTLEGVRWIASSPHHAIAVL